MSIFKEPKKMDIDQSREYLVKFMDQYFTDRTFHRYILAQRSIANLAGDFAWELARAIRIIKQPPIWISVKERLPADDCHVLVASWRYITGEQRITSGHYSHGLGCFSERDVTHWMDLPSGPDEVKK